MRSKFPAFLKGPSRELWDVDGALTSILWWKKSQQKKNLHNTLVLFVPGNPGVIDYYQEFLQCLYAYSNANLDIVGVQHAGHESFDCGRDLYSSIDSKNEIIQPKVKIIYDGSLSERDLFLRRNQKHSWNLQEQITHKLAIVDHLFKHSYQNHKLIIIGHSVGTYIGTQLLRYIPSERISAVYNLFPTVENIRDTPNGHRLWPLFNPIGRTAACVSASFLRNIIREDLLTRVIQYVTSQEEHEARITVKLIHPHVASNTLLMATHEMEEIAELDAEIFDTHIDRMVFYYGKSDGWVPLTRYEEMTKRYPKARVLLCTHDLPHAFVLGGEGAVKMAEIVWSWVDELQKKY